MLATLGWILAGSPKAEEKPTRLRPSGRNRMVVRGQMGVWTASMVSKDHEHHQPKHHERHEPSYGRRGVWPRPRRMLVVHAEPQFLQVRPAYRGAADRVRAAGRGRPYLPRADLSHPL